MRNRRILCRMLSLLACSALLLAPVASAQAEMLGSGSSGTSVYRLQRRLADLDYFNFKATGNYGSMTRSAVMLFQQYNGLSADGTAGETTIAALFGSSAKRNPIAAKIPFGPTEGTTSTGGMAVEWSEVDGLFSVGSRCQLTDLITSTTFRIERTGGTNHAEVKPVTTDDEEAYLSIFGGTANWSKRAVTVSIDGRRIAASLSGMPDDSGSCCLYFTGSTSDVFGFADAEHQKNIVKATA